MSADSILVPDLAVTFAEKRYLILRNLISAPNAQTLAAYVQKQAELGRLIHDKQVGSSLSAYADANIEKLLVKLQPALEQITGLSLFPTYSYYRFYNRGAELERHRDRPACEISLSLNLGQKPTTPWPLWIQYAGNSYGAELHPGDALLYRGIECVHWREPFQGDNAAQVFLHYVDANGPNAVWKFDKRPNLNIIK
jgi:hypothetical protein